MADGETVAEAVGLRGYKKARTRAAIEDAALQLFCEKGFDETTIADIAREVVISPRTFFRYFTSKEDVVFASEREILLAIGEQLARRPPEESLRDALLAVLLPLLETYDATCAQKLSRFEIIVASPALRGELLLIMFGVEQVLCDALAPRMGLNADSPRLRLIAAVIVAAFRLAEEKWTELEGRVSLGELLREHFDLLHDGLLA